MSDSQLREHIATLLEGRGAHVDFDHAIADVPANARGVTPDGAAHSPWDILEHMRIAQWDILEFSRNPEHISPDWPNGYWPDDSQPPTKTAWNKSVSAIKSDLDAMIDLVKNPESDLLTPFPHGEGQTLLREALVLADHNAYHLGELVIVRRLLGVWE
ncbi:MAG: DinB family protein [candidate division Zixibacteria bacterium]|nr:DinB family protein [candidate division Zixibacteria bacterium]